MVTVGEQDTRKRTIRKHTSILFIGVVFGLEIVCYKYNEYAGQH
jgi:hypothetical protein